MINTIAVDLTPLCPGAENGGARIFIFELIKELARLAPNTTFVLIAGASLDAEFSTSLTAANVQWLILDNKSKGGGEWKSWFGRHLRLIVSRRYPNTVARLKRFLAMLPRSSPIPSSIHKLHADLFFYPFTAPLYYDPNTPAVATIYDLQFGTYPQFFSTKDCAERRKNFIDACKRCDALAAISEYSRQRTIDHGLIDPLRIRTIYLRMAARLDKTDHSEILQNLSLNQKTYFIYPANYWVHKNHEMLLTSFCIARRNGLPATIKLICTGSPGARREQLIEIARRFNLTDNVIFLGYLADSDFACLMKNALGLIFPSLYEGFGLPVIEAMAHGVPVACSNSTSLPEVAGDAAMMFDPRIPTDIATVLINLGLNDMARERCRKAGLARAAEFASSERMAQEYWDLFTFAVNQRKDATELFGGYADGWIGPELTLRVSSKLHVTTVEWGIFAPDWLPYDKLSVSVTDKDGVDCARWELRRGESGRLEFDIRRNSSIHIKTSPTFSPEKLGLNSDTRELAAMITGFTLVCEDGARITLFPEA